MAVSIVFNMINVSGQETNATVSVGEVQQNGWSAHAKQNAGNMMLFGINNVIVPITNIFDNDVIDSPINDNDITGAAQGQAL